MTQRFDLTKFSDLPADGVTLIEASAGTGKTYTIAGLFLCLILERGLGVGEILVVTFTEAATQELKDRILKRLREADAVLSGGKTEDGFLQHLKDTCPSPSEWQSRIQEALRDFDEAAIFTIHGFCKRMLNEFTFESGALFDTELVPDQEDLKREIVEDFWRKRLYGASSLFVRYALNKKLSPEALLSLVSGPAAQPDVRIIPQVDPSDAEPDEAAFSEAFHRVRQEWQKCKDDAVHILLESDALNRTRYRKTSIPGWVLEMDGCLAAERPDPNLPEILEKFTASGIQKGVNKGKSPPEHPFFLLCQDLSEKQKVLVRIFDEKILALKGELFSEFHQSLKRKKADDNVQSFDDLLTGLRDALRARGGDELADGIRGKYRAALIDEFQDTDPVQYEIFKTVFETPGHLLFLIGDPKQAIYGFRGADIFAYMSARPGARYTLGENWRSDPGLVEAVNAVFSSREQAFIYPEIPFEPTRPAPEKKDRKLFEVDGHTRPQLQMWVVRPGGESSGKPMSKGQAGPVIIRAAASEISRVLHLADAKRAMLGGRPVRPADMAVLVRRNQEAEDLKAALIALNIPAVLYAAGDVFASSEAEEMDRLIRAAARPRSERRVRAALVTEMMGLSGEDIEALSQNEEAWESWVDRFSEYRRVWESRGFIRMFKALMAHADILPRLMALPDGERRCTNILHLAELLHQTETGRNTGITGLVKWLAEQRARPRGEHPLRLESDENAVRLVTIHKSKGLEYPIVFCPFTWDGSKSRNDSNPALFHDENHERRLTCDLGSDQMELHRSWAEKETLAENLRLLYVALTRAQNQCYLVWGRLNTAETSAPAYLLHGGPSGPGHDPLAETETAFKSLDDAALMNALSILEARSHGALSVSDIPAEPGLAWNPAPEKIEDLKCREFQGRIQSDYRIASFSSLISGTSRQDADYDAIRTLPSAVESAPAEALQSMFDFPGGTRPGSCLHEIFEHIDFTEKDPDKTGGIVSETLAKYGFDLKWKDPALAMIQKVLNAPLIPDHPDFTLSVITPSDRINEMEFYFPLKALTPQTLAEIFQSSSPNLSPHLTPKIDRLNFSPVQGFMKGFIDLVFQFKGKFYLADWKSNILGRSVEDYHADALNRVMAAEHYILQYHLYTLALHQYLRLRVPGYQYETHFGEVFYLFLRGIDPEKGDYGIYRGRPPADMVETLSRRLIGNGGASIAST